MAKKKILQAYHMICLLFISANENVRMTPAKILVLKRNISGMLGVTKIINFVFFILFVKYMIK